jgi:hypothetical protein
MPFFALVLFVLDSQSKLQLTSTRQGILFPDLVDVAEEDIATFCSAIRGRGGLINDPNGVVAHPRSETQASRCQLLQRDV